MIGNYVFYNGMAVVVTVKHLNLVLTQYCLSSAVCSLKLSSLLQIFITCLVVNSRCSYTNSVFSGSEDKHIAIWDIDLFLLDSEPIKNLTVCTHSVQ